MPDKPSHSSRKGRPKGSATFAWRAFFQQAQTPIFVLGKGRLRFANAAWERSAGVKLADSLGLVCTARRHSSPLAVAMAPTPEALSGRVDKSRRTAPQHRFGPPWWDVTFVPLAGDDGAIGIVGFIEVIGEVGPAASRKIPAAVMALRDRHAGRFSLDLFAGQSSAVKRFAGQLRLASQLSAPIWLLGEPGSGKETAARVIHHSGPRRENMFVALDGAGVQPFLIESLLWGHGGLIDSDRLGTIYLKEPASLPRDLQQRFVEEFSRERRRVSSPLAVFPQFVCASTRPVIDDVKAGKLLSEFHSLFSLLELRLPPLRERLDDMTRLVSWLLTRHNDKSIDAKAIAVLKEHSWPGNLCELNSVLADAAASAGTGPILREHLPRELRERLGIAKPSPEKSLALDATLESVEKRLITLALAKANGNATRASDLLGIWRTRLLRRIEALGIGERPAGERHAGERPA